MFLKNYEVIRIKSAIFHKTEIYFANEKNLAIFAAKKNVIWTNMLKTTVDKKMMKM